MIFGSKRGREILVALTFCPSSFCPSPAPPQLPQFPPLKGEETEAALWGRFLPRMPRSATLKTETVAETKILLFCGNTLVSGNHEATHHPLVVWGFDDLEPLIVDQLLNYLLDRLLRLGALRIPIQNFGHDISEPLR